MPRTRAKGPSVGQIISRILFYLLVVFILIYTIFPFYWAVVTSFKRGGDLFLTPVQYFPDPVSLESYDYVFTNGDFLRALLNSTIVSLVTVLLALAIGSLAAYALGRLPFRGKNVVLYTTLAMTTFPAIAILPALFQMVRATNLYNTLTALIFTYLTFTLPFTVWVLTNFFKTLPAELEEASLVDGATPFQTFYLVLLPLAAPGLVTTGLLAFIAAWSEFLFALTFTQDYHARTVQVAIAQFSGNTGYELPWGNIMAASVLVTVPLIVLVLIFQRRIIAGLTAGAVKG
ncbi:MAG TPA: carbohydrate ABC transporter permease [Roseiflexaceae bacterium]|nr:carbohydrate ABC transporter permease [Roseiflexaceae bacterium]